jgi:hypothetical protein
MTLTGLPRGLPALSPAPAFGLLEEAIAQLAAATAVTGTAVHADPADLLAGRAALTGLVRQGQVSAGGSTRLLGCADGWCAVTLSRASDRDAVPAILGVLGLDMPAVGTRAAADDGQPAAAWAALTAAAPTRSAAAVADAAQLLGVPAAALPATAPPFSGQSPASDADVRWPLRVPTGQVTRIAPAAPGARLGGALVVDLSSMWAGPLSARLLGLAGARVVKVETPGRPDGARAGNADFFGWLHAGHRSVVLDFRTPTGRDALAALLAAADVVIEASRPRALEQLGLGPGQARQRAGQVWLSITGYGRLAPDRVAFGDDAAVGGGLVGWVAGPGARYPAGGGSVPVFCADAVADPLTGVCGALAVARALAAGGGELIDLAMRDVASGFAACRAVHSGRHTVHPGRDAGHPGGTQDGAVVHCAAFGRTQAVLPPARPASGGGPAAEFGADTSAVLGALVPLPALRPGRCQQLLLHGCRHPRAVGRVHRRGVPAAAARYCPRAQLLEGPARHPGRPVEPDRMVEAGAGAQPAGLVGDQGARDVGGVGEDSRVQQRILGQRLGTPDPEPVGQPPRWIVDQEFERLVPLVRPRLQRFQRRQVRDGVYFVVGHRLGHRRRDSERGQHAEDDRAVLDHQHPAGGKRPPVPVAFHLEQRRAAGVALADEVAVHRMREPARLDREAGSEQRLGDRLPAVHAPGIVDYQARPVQVVLDVLQVEKVQDGGHVSHGRSF